MDSIIGIKQPDDEFFKVRAVDSPEVLAIFKHIENSYFLLITGELVAFPIDEIVKAHGIKPKLGRNDTPGIYAQSPTTQDIYDLNEIINVLNGTGDYLPLTETT